MWLRTSEEGTQEAVELTASHVFMGEDKEGGVLVYVAAYVRGGNPRGGGRDTATKVEQKGGIDGIPLFCTPAENGDKARFDKVCYLLKSHIIQTLYRGTDIMGILTNLEDVAIPEPINLTAEEESSKFKVKVWNPELEEYMTHKAQMKENKVILHTIVWDQCSKSMRVKVKGTDAYEAAKFTNDCLWLLKTIRGICLSYESSKTKVLSLDDALEQFITSCQDTKSNDDFFKAFNSLVSIYEHLGGTLVHGNAFNDEMNTIINDSSQDEAIATKKATRLIRDRILATAFIKHSGNKFAPLRRELANAYALGDDRYPSDPFTALGVLNAYVAPAPAPREKGPAPRGNGNRHHQFAQVSSTPVAGTNGTIWNDVTCYNCNCIGHYSRDCPDPATGKTIAAVVAAAPSSAGRGTGSQVSSKFLQKHEIGNSISNALNVLLTQASRSSLINPNWIFLDSEFTVCDFRNKALLTNIGDSPFSQILKVYTNGDSQKSTKVGTLDGFGEVWYNPESLANILSMAAVRKVFRITMDSSVDAAMYVRLPTGGKLRFAEGPSGLYYCDVSSLFFIKCRSEQG